MANLGDLKERIIAETNREDLGPGEELEKTLALTIGRAIEHFADEQYWFNRANAPTVTVAGSAFVNLPHQIRVARGVTREGRALRKAQADGMEAVPGTSGMPTSWADYGDRLLLWPVPDAAYALNVHGTAQLHVPEEDEDESAWTNEACDLIAARTRFLLFRDIFRDVEGTQLAAQAEGEALTRLRRETRRRSVTALGAVGDEPWAVR